MRAMTTSQNLRRRTVALTAMLALTTLGAACINQPPPPGPTGPPDPTAAPRAAAGTWLVSQFDTGTGLIPSAYVPGANDLLGSAQAAATLGLTGTGAATASAAVAALATQVDAAVKDGSGNDKPGALARLILPPEIHLQAPPNLSDDFGVLLDAGIDDFLGKPFDTKDLAAVLLKWLERKDSRPTSSA